jgi:hypothetical protein
MPSITPQDLHIDAALTTWSREYASQQSQMIGHLVAPEIPVVKQSDSYWIHGAETHELSVVDRGAGAQYGEIKWAKSTGSYNCFGYGLKAVVAKESMANADAEVDPAKDALAIPIAQLQLAYEKRVADLAFATGTFTQTSALAAADRWNATTGDPIDDVSYAKDYVRGKIGFEPNAAVVGYDVFRALQVNDAIRKCVFGLNAPESLPTEAQVAEALGLKRLLVGRATYLSAANTFTDIWGKYALIAYIDPNPMSKSICPLKTFVWKVDGGGRYATRGPVWDDDVKGWKYYCDDYTDEAVVSLYSAYLYSTVVD